jgi:hypothetical protein
MLWYYVLVDRLYRENSIKLGTGFIFKPTFERVQRERERERSRLKKEDTINLSIAETYSPKITWPISMNFLNKLLNMNF